MRKAAIGVDIGGTNTAVGLVDEQGHILAKYTDIRTQNYDDVHDFYHDLHGVIKSFVEKSPDIEIAGIGFGAPNGNFYTGTIEFAPNIPKWKGTIHIARDFKEYIHLPVYLTNDANAAAMGEMIYGGAKKMKDFIMITLGTGVGSGIVVGGEMVYGHDGFAGEIGHTIVYPEGRLCGCGRRGCLETYTSASGIKRTVFELLAASQAESILRTISYNDLTSKQIDEAAHKGDKIAMEAFDITGRILGLKLADAAAHTSPEAIFLFGGLAQAGDLIFEPVKKYMEFYLLDIYKNKIKLLPSRLPHGEAAILGASALVWKHGKG